MMCPLQLLAVPNMQHELTVKADLNGVTVLRQGRYRKRYTGSKQFEVDINGKLRTTNELKKILLTDAPAWAKKSKGAPRRPDIKTTYDVVAKVQKAYRINKPEIRARIFATIAAQPREHKELYFWTVTFPKGTPDETAYRLFNTWLTKLRQQRLLQNYLWIAERQTGERLTDPGKVATNTIHFHLAIPHKMPVKVANREMMICLSTASKAGEVPFSLAQCKRYNGVDIAKNRSSRKVTNFALGRKGRRALVGYIAKYVTKNDGSFLHLAWHNSRGFSCLFTGVTFTYAESRDLYHWRFFTHSRPAIVSEYFLYFPWINGPPGNLEGELQKLNGFISNLNLNDHGGSYLFN